MQNIEQVFLYMKDEITSAASVERQAILDEVKKLKELIQKLNNNDEYIYLMKEFEKNQVNYVKDNVLKEKIIELRKKLFEIEELKEYLSIESNLRLFSNQISNIISSIVNERNC